MAKHPTIGLAAVETEPLHEKVYREIVRALISGQFMPGQKLTSRKLAHELGTSDMPVRAALMRLQAVQALRSLPNGTLEVPQMTAPSFAQLMDSRIVVETAAAEKATAHINGNNLRTIRRLGDELTDAASACDVRRYFTIDHSFKFSIYQHCANAPLLFLIETIWMQVGPFLRHFGDNFAGQVTEGMAMDSHGQVLEALISGHAAGVRKAIAQDIGESAAFLLKHATFSLE